MTPATSIPAVPATLLLALALVAPALPAGAEGLPDIQPGVPGFDCFYGGDAGDSFANASYLSSDGTNCQGTLTPVLDEQDWFQFWAREGTWVNVNLFGYVGDGDLCAFAPSNADEPLECSKAPLFGFDYLSFDAEETGHYRLQVYAATGAVVYNLWVSAYPPPPFPAPDAAILDLVAEKPLLRTDLVEAGIVNPLGAWKLTAEVANLGEGWTCDAEVYFFITGEEVVPPLELAPFFVIGPGQFGETIGPFELCLAPGEVEEVRVDWRPKTTVGDIEIQAVVWADGDQVYENNQRSVETFVLVGGL